jgi:STE24 endopeptidase
MNMDLSEFPIYKQGGYTQSSDGIPYFQYTVIFAVSVFFFEYWLDIRQYIKFATSKSLPTELKGKFPEEKFLKSLAYGKDKAGFGLFEGLVMFAEGTVLLMLGYLPWAWDLSRSWCLRFGLLGATSSPMWSEIVQSVGLFVILSMHDTIVGLPFSLYSTFVVEAKHGFNKTTLGLYIKDKIMTMALMFGIGSPVLGAVIWVIRWGGPHFYFYVWLLLFVISLVMLTVYPEYIAPLFNDYKKLEDGPVYDAVAKLAKQVDFPLTKLFVVDGSRRSAHSNAYFYGFFKNKRIVLYDTLIDQVTIEELRAILGHEIGHWRLNHTVQGLIITQIYTFVMFLCFSFVMNSAALFAAFGFAPVEVDGAMMMPVIIGLVLFTQTFWSPVDKILNLAMNFNSRRNEFAADKYGKDLGMAKELASGLIKISIENLGNMVPDPLYSAYHFSHPPVVERLAALLDSKKSD